MTSIRDIVVPVDFSEPSHEALRYAIGLCKRLGARLHVLHAMHLPPELRMRGSWTATLRGHALRELGELCDEALAAGLEVTSQLVDGYPSEAIRDYARDARAGLIVIGSRGRSALSHVVIGSTADRTIRTAPCPVLTVKKPRPARAEEAA